jgi:hypothetical protein
MGLTFSKQPLKQIEQRVFVSVRAGAQTQKAPISGVLLNPEFRDLEQQRRLKGIAVASSNGSDS